MLDSVRHGCLTDETIDTLKSHVRIGMFYSISYIQRIHACRVVTLQIRLAVSLIHEALGKWRTYLYSSMSKDLSQAAISLNEKVWYKRQGPGHGCFCFFSRVIMSALDGVASSSKNAGRVGFWYQMELYFTLVEDKDQLTRLS